MRRDVPAWVSDYVGISYRPGGRTREQCDCWGLFALVLKEQFGVSLEEYDGPMFQGRRDAQAVGEAAAAFAARFNQIEPGQERLGDGILIRMLGVPLHVATVVAPGWMLHIEEACDAVVENYRGRAWSGRLLGFYRVVA